MPPTTNFLKVNTKLYEPETIECSNKIYSILKPRGKVLFNGRTFELCNTRYHLQGELEELLKKNLPKKWESYVGIDRNFKNSNLEITLKPKDLISGPEGIKKTKKMFLLHKKITTENDAHQISKQVIPLVRAMHALDLKDNQDEMVDLCQGSSGWNMISNPHQNKMQNLKLNVLKGCTVFDRVRIDS